MKNQQGFTYKITILLISIVLVVGAIGFVVISSDDENIDSFTDQSATNIEPNNDGQTKEAGLTFFDDRLELVDNKKFKKIDDHPYGKTTYCGILPDAPEGSGCIDQVILAAVDGPDTFNELNNDFIHISIFEKSNLNLDEWVSTYVAEGIAEQVSTDDSPINGLDARVRKVVYGPNDIRYYTVIYDKENIFLMRYFTDGDQQKINDYLELANSAEFLP